MWDLGLFCTKLSRTVQGLERQNEWVTAAPNVGLRPEQGTIQRSFLGSL